MTRLARLAISFLFLSFSQAHSEMATEERTGTRAYWMLNPGKYAADNSEGKTRLEACVARAGLVKELRVLPAGGSNVIEIEVFNALSSPIAGLVVQPESQRLKQLGLDSRTLIEFEAVPPGGNFTFRQEIEGFSDVFPAEASVKLTAWDVVNEDGVEVVEHVFWSHWPLVSSEEDLAMIQRELCDQAGDSSGLK